MTEVWQKKPIKDGVYICLKGVFAFHKLAKASCANLNTTYYKHLSVQLPWDTHTEMEPIQLVSQRASTNEIKSNQASFLWKVLFASLSQSSVVPNLNDLGALPLFLPKCNSESTLVELKLSGSALSQPFFCPLGNADSQKLKLMTGKDLFWEMS